METLVGVQEVARALGVHPGTLYSVDFRQRLGLSVVRIGRAVRFRPTDIERVIEANRQEPARAS